MAPSRTIPQITLRKFITLTSPNMCHQKIISVYQNHRLLTPKSALESVLLRVLRKLHLCVNRHSNNISSREKDPFLVARIHVRVQSLRWLISHWRNDQEHELHQSIWVWIKHRQLLEGNWIIWIIATIVHQRSPLSRVLVYCIMHFKHTPPCKPLPIMIGSNSINAQIAEEVTVVKINIAFNFNVAHVKLCVAIFNKFQGSHSINIFSNNFFLCHFYLTTSQHITYIIIQCNKNYNNNNE